MEKLFFYGSQRAMTLLHLGWFGNEGQTSSLGGTQYWGILCSDLGVQLRQQPSEFLSYSYAQVCLHHANNSASIAHTYQSPAEW